MRRVDEKVLKALCNLEGNPDFRVIQEWFLDSAADQDKIMRQAEGPTMIYRAQGASKVLLEFCELAATPRDKAGKLAMEKAGIRINPVGEPKRPTEATGFY